MTWHDKYYQIKIMLKASSEETLDDVIDYLHWQARHNIDIDVKTVSKS